MSNLHKNIYYYLCGKFLSGIEKKLQKKLAKYSVTLTLF